MRVVRVGDPPFACGPGLGFDPDLGTLVEKLRTQGVECVRPDPGETSPERFAAFLDACGPDVVHVEGKPDEAAALLAVVRRRQTPVVVSMPDYSWICERGTCVDATGVLCLPAVTPGSCACVAGSRALAARNACLRSALRTSDVALIPPGVARERMVASGVPAVLRVIDPVAPGAAERLRAAYEEAIERVRAAAVAEDPPKFRRVLFIVGASGSPLRYRVHQKVEQLAVHGIASHIAWYADPELPAALVGADAVIVYRAPATKQFVKLIREVRRGGTPTFWDVDDLIFDPEEVLELPIHRGRSRDELNGWLENAHRYRGMLLECGAGIASTPEVARHMVRMGVPAQIHPNGVDTPYAVVFEGARRAARQSPERGFTVGYCSGSDTHDEDFEMVAEELAGFLDAHREARLMLVGPLALPRGLKRLSRRITKVGWVPGADVPRYLARFDLNIAPLVEHDFTNGKSAIKWSEAAEVGVSTVAWATEPFRAAIDDGRTGLLVRNTKEFRERLEWAIAHRVELPTMAEAARLAAFEQGSPWVLGAQLIHLIGNPERTPIATSENRWPEEAYTIETEPGGLIPGLMPKGRNGAAERLDRARVGFRYPLSRGPLLRADVQIASWTEPVHSPLELRIRVGRQVLASVTVAPQDMVDNGWVNFTFDPPVPPYRGAIAELCSDRSQNIAPYMTRGGSRIVDGVWARGALMARTFHSPPVPPVFTVPRPISSPALAASRFGAWVTSRRRIARRAVRLVARRLGIRRPRLAIARAASTGGGGEA